MPVYAVIVLVAGAAMLLLVHLGGLAIHRARARTAADAAALAGAAEGREAATRVAAANGAVLESFTERGDDVEVRVRVDSTHATAWARRDHDTRPCRSAAQARPVVFAMCQPSRPG